MDSSIKFELWTVLGTIKATKLVAFIVKCQTNWKCISSTAKTYQRRTFNNSQLFERFSKIQFTSPYYCSLTFPYAVI